jgi:hypothetical protein
MMRRIASLALLLAVTGCSGTTRLTPSTTASVPLGVSAARRDHHRKSRVRIVIEIPRRKHHRKRGRMSPRWISPDTQSVVFGQGIDESATPPQIIDPTIIDISQCPVSGAYAICSETVWWDAGSYLAYAGAFSGANGTGQVLSEATGGLDVILGQTDSLTLTLGGVMASVAESQNVLLRGGTASSSTIDFTAYDASGARITGSDQFDFPLDTPAMSIKCFIAPMTTSCPTWVSASSGNAASIAYDGQSPINPESNGDPPYLAANVNFNSDVGQVHQFLFSFYPVLDDGTTVSPQTLHFAGPSSPAQSVTVAGQPVASATLDGCGSATATISGDTVTVTPAADTTVACTLQLLGSVDHYYSTQSVYVPITVGASTTPTDNFYGVATPNAMRFSSASSSAQTLTITPPPGYSGSVTLGASDCYGMTAASVPYGGGPDNGNAVAMSAIMAVSPSTTQSTSGGAPVTFSITPKAQGVCELQATDGAYDTFTYPVVAVGP